MSKLLCYLSKSIITALGVVIVLTLVSAIVAGGYAITQASVGEVKEGLVALLIVCGVFGVLYWAVERSENC